MATKLESQLMHKRDQELERRDREAFRIYRPSTQQLPVHRSDAKEILARGGKRSGKSTAVALEFASRILGIPITAMDGGVIPLKWPASEPDHHRLYWIIGWDINHSATIYKLLFEKGMGGTLRAIKDEVTGQWRTYDRTNPRDRERYRSSKLAEPIIPERFIDMDSWSWEEKKALQFKSVRLKNGASIHCYPSSARNPKQGEAVSGIWVDEDIQYPHHLKEWQDRLTDEEGWFLWSVWPHIKNDALINLLDRAEASVEESEPQIQAFQLIMTDNPYLTDKSKRESLNMMETEEEVARRNRGELLLDTISMYDFYPNQHLIKRLDDKKTREHRLVTLLRTIWSESNSFPRDWTRYLSLDPSHTRTGVHSWVIPPPEWEHIGNIVICEWELMAKKFSADMLARELAKLMQGVPYEGFIMDKHAGRQTHAGRDNTTFDVYSQAFGIHKLFSRLTNNSFFPGCDIVSTRTKAVRDLLTISPSGIPGMMFVEERCLETRKEFNTYRKKMGIVGGVETILDEPANPRIHDAMLSTEYFAAYIVPQFAMGTAYVSPGEWMPKGSPAYYRAMEILNRQNNSDSEYVHLGPGTAA